MNGFEQETSEVITNDVLLYIQKVIIQQVSTIKMAAIEGYVNASQREVQPASYIIRTSFI